MKKLIKNLGDFHFGCEVAEFKSMNKTPKEFRELRMRLLKEEFEEYLKAEKENDEIEIADALGDMIYIAVGTARVYGIPLEKVWAEIQRSNISKIDSKTGKVIKREDGKILKPEGWTGPQIPEILEKRDFKEENQSFIGEIFEFLGERKKFWLFPILILLVGLGFLLTFSSSSIFAPFIYTLF